MSRVPLSLGVLLVCERRRRAGHLLSVALLLVAIASCAEDGPSTPPADELYDRIMASLRSDDDVLHLRFAFTDSAGDPSEEYDLWVDWAGQRAREKRHADGRTEVRLVDGLTERTGVGTTEERRQPVESFIYGALPPGLHLFQTLWIDGLTTVEPVQVAETGEGTIQVTGAFSYESEGAVTCVGVTLFLDADTYRPIRSWGQPCESEDGERISETVYQSIEFVPLSAFP